MRLRDARAPRRRRPATAATTRPRRATAPDTATRPCHAVIVLSAINLLAIVRHVTRCSHREHGGLGCVARWERRDCGRRQNRVDRPPRRGKGHSRGGADVRRRRGRALVSDGDCVALEGFTHLIPFEAGHEIIRQGRRELELIRMTPDLLYDQMIGMGVARRLVFSYGGNPGVGGLHRFRDAIENELAAAGRDRGAQPRRDGEPLRGGRRRPAVRGDARLRRDRPGGAHHGGADHLPVHRRAADGGAGAPSRRRDRPRPGGRPGRQRAAVGHPRRPEGGDARRAAVAGDRRADRRRARAAARRDHDPGLGDRRGRRGARRLAPVLQPRHHRPRQRLLQVLGQDQPRPRRSSPSG